MAVNEKINLLDLKKASKEQEKIIENYKNSNSSFNSVLYGITKDLFFYTYNKEYYCRKLPFKANGLDIYPFKERSSFMDKKNPKGFIQKEIIKIFTGIHIFYNEDDFNKINNESKRRTFYKEVEHSKGDNFDNYTRIKTGSSGEFAFEKWSGLKTTDFSQPSFNSMDFLVADNKDLNIGIKTSKLENPSYIIEKNTYRNEILTSLYQWENISENHIVIRGFVKKDVLNNPYFHTTKVIKSNSLLAKFILNNHKIGAVFSKKEINPIYSLNEINFNENNKKIYTGKNFKINEDIDFFNLSDKFINKFEEILNDSDTNILYVPVFCIGFDNMVEAAQKYLFSQNDKKRKFEEFAKKYKIGVVFYDKKYFNMIAVDNKNYYHNYLNDPYFIGTLDKNGNTI